jgi:hypothetical protein
LHATATYNAEALKSRLWPSASAHVGVVSTALGSYIGIGPQAFDPTPALQPLLIVPLGTQPGWIQTYISAAPDSTEYPVTLGFRAPVTHSTPIAGPLLGVTVRVGQQSYSDVQPQIVASLVLGGLPPTVPIATRVQIGPQAFDFTQQAFWDAPQPGPLKGAVPPWLSAAPQPIDLTQQGLFTQPYTLGQGKLGAFVRVLPQQYDYTLQANYTPLITAAIVYIPRGAIILSLGDYGRRLVL